MFAVAQVKGTLASLNLDGSPVLSDIVEAPVTQLTYRGWTVSLEDIQAYVSAGTVSVPVFELLLRMLIPNIASNRKEVGVGNSFYLFAPEQKKKTS